MGNIFCSEQRGIKRKSSTDPETLNKRTRLSESEDPTNPEEDVDARGKKRKGREDGEGQPKSKGRRLDKELVSSSSANSGEESCNTSLEDVRVGKRKADGEGPNKKKKRRMNLKKTKLETKEDLSVDALRAEFEAKYKQQKMFGEGGCGSVFAGYRKADNLPVAIKHIPKDNILCKHVDDDGKQLPSEVAVMLKLVDKTSGSVGTSASVSLLDWYDLDQELILVLERPIPAEDLLKYIKHNGGSLQEEEAKTIVKQLVDALIELQDKGIFHRDIKVENILIETGSDVPRVRLIDFGLSCFVKTGASYRVFYGTPDHVPPEWLWGHGYTAGPGTVWQLGVVLFETVHRDTEFVTTDFIGPWWIKILFGQRISKNLSKDCQDFMRRCLSLHPDQRPTLEQLRIHPWLR